MKVSVSNGRGTGRATDGARAYGTRKLFQDAKDMVLSPSEMAVAGSVIYASLFDYPLTLDQLHQTLLESTLSVSEILETYRSSCTLQAIIEYRDGFFFLAGKHSLVAERRRREARSRAFLDRHRRLLAVVCAVPYTRLVALSGSVAHMNLERDGDLDLFIVTRGRHVWSVTVAVLLIAKMMRSRHILCANFVVADSDLAIGQDDLFTANQIIHLKPLVGADLFGEFVAANPSVARFYPNFRKRDAAADVFFDPRRGRARLKSGLERLFAIPARVVEPVCRYLYGSHLRRRAGAWPSPGEVQLRQTYLKLHSQSHKRSILERFALAMSTLQGAGATVMEMGAERDPQNVGAKLRRLVCR
jgi:hypothetical protein